MNDALNRQAHYSYIYIFLISMVAALGGLLFGYDWVVIGGAKPFYEAFFHITSPIQRGWVMSSAFCGCIIGALVAGVMSDRWGRKNILTATSVIFVIAALGTALSYQLDLFIFFRVVTGLAIGMASAISPIYIAEVAPPQLRGRMVAINQLAIVIGILAAQIANLAIAQYVPPHLTPYAFSHTWNVTLGWRYMFGSGAIPALLFFVAVFFIPRSPRWLVRQGHQQQAGAILSRIGGKQYAEEAIHTIMTSLSALKSVNIQDLWRNGAWRILMVGIVLAVFQQWCGINVIFNYAQEVFAAAGYSVNGILMNIVIVGCVNLIFTIVAMFLVDRMGRRRLLLIGSTLLLVIFALMGVCYYYHVTGILVLSLVMLAIASYATTLAPVTWVVLSEIFPTAIRGTAMGIATLMLWVGNFTLAFSFPVLNAKLGPAGTFWLYALVCFFGMIFIYWRLPETKQRSLEALANLFQPH